LITNAGSTDMDGCKFWLPQSLTFFLIFLAGTIPGIDLLKDSQYRNLICNPLKIDLTSADDYICKGSFVNLSEAVSRTVLRTARIPRYIFFLLLSALFLSSLDKAIFLFYSLHLTRISQSHTISVIALFLGGRAPPCLN
jgi:hypothetical protein